MTKELVPKKIRENYEIMEWKHSIAILKHDFPREWKDLLELLNKFQLKKSWITEGGGSKSRISGSIDQFFYDNGWEEKEFLTQICVNGNEVKVPTHKVDCYRNSVALEIEWNNKDPFYDRDLNNFRLLFELRAISVGIIITRTDELQELFKELGKGSSYGASTTHMSKLIPRIEGGGGGGCPILVFGLTRKLYIDD